MMANWRELIAECADGDEFTAWSQDYVYFPAVSDEGNEWVDRVPRNPRDTATKHVGGHQK